MRLWRAEGGVGCMEWKMSVRGVRGGDVMGWKKGGDVRESREEVDR